MGEDASRLKTLSSSDFYFCQEASYNDVHEIIKKRICSCSHCAASRGSAASQLFGQTEALLDSCPWWCIASISLLFVTSQRAYFWICAVAH